MKGIISEGMILFASLENKIQILEVPAGTVPGDIVTFSDYPGNIIHCSIENVEVIINVNVVVKETLQSFMWE